MSSHGRFSGALRCPAAVPASRFSLRWCGLAFLAGLLAGCAANAQSQLLAGANPADPRSPSRPIGYRSVTTGYVSQRPVSPAPWRPQNERATPSSRSDQ